MDHSKTMGKMVGAYLIIVGLALITNLPQYQQIMQSFIQSKPLLLLSGFMALIVGLVMVAYHNIWCWNWRVINTIIGWVVIFKALNLIWYPRYVENLSIVLIKNNHFVYSAAIAEIVLGLILCYFSFRHER